MDAEVLELLLATVDRLWPQPLPDEELHRWSLAFRPGPGVGVDAELALDVLTAMRSAGIDRPTPADFTEAYRRWQRTGPRRSRQRPTAAATSALASARASLKAADR